MYVYYEIKIKPGVLSVGGVEEVICKSSVHVIFTVIYSITRSWLMSSLNFRYGCEFDLIYGV